MRTACAAPPPFENTFLSRCGAPLLRHGSTIFTEAKATNIDRNSEQPCSDCRATFERIPDGIGLEESLLRGFLGFGLIEERREAEPNNVGPMGSQHAFEFCFFAVHSD